jgi:hypothetical protein
VNEQEQNQLAANAANWLKDHRPTLLVNSGGVEAWRFKQPGSGNLAFDICVTRYGIAMFGDIDGLTWRVGADYGINFLRNKSIGYVHEKLEAGCKEVEIDKDAIFETIRDCICDALEESGIEIDAFEELDDLCEWMKAKVDEEDTSQPYEEWLELISAVDAFDEGRDRDIVPAYDLLAASENLLQRGDLWETGITKPTKSLMQRLEYVRYAANQIMAMKELGSPAQ